jgi:hypothetical protein
VAGEYHVANGRIIGPNGQPFVADGVCLLDAVVNVAITGPDCRPLLDHYPTLNFVHLVNSSWTDPLPEPSHSAIEWLTAKGIVVQLGSYPHWPPVPTGPALDQEVAWARGMARRYKTNPRVWGCTSNEPQDWWVGLPAGSITAEHNAIYDAWRGEGANNIIGLLPTGGVYADGLDFSKYGHMRNVHWNCHYYNWLAQGSNDLEYNKQMVRNGINDVHRIQSADGVIPCGCYEYGNATDGANVDSGGWATVQAVLEVYSLEGHSGGAAFVYSYWPSWMGGSPYADQLTDEWAGGAMTDYGKQVQTHYATGAHS